MDPTTSLLIVLLAFAVLLALEVPIAYCLALSGALGIALTRGVDIASSSMAGTPFEAVATYSLAIVPMYVLVGMFALSARIAEHVYQVADRVLLRVRGGLGIATIVACAGFAAVTGSSVATAATVGQLAVGEMRKRGYSGAMASGIVAAGGTLGILIPPSIILAIYGILARQSIGALLLAGIVPGVLSALVYTVYLGIRGTGKQLVEDDLPIPAGDPVSHVDQDTPWRSLPWRGFVRVVVLFVIIMSGVYTGVFTVTESGALGALFAFAILVVELRKRGIRRILSVTKSALQDVAATTSMAFFIFVGSSIFTFYLVSAGIPTAFTEWVSTTAVTARNPIP